MKNDIGIEARTFRIFSNIDGINKRFSIVLSVNKRYSTAIPRYIRFRLSR
jgi:hypothetical protein